MVHINGLAVVLAIFEGIIIQCEGVGDENLPKRIQRAPNNVTNEDEPFLPKDLIEEIISKSDFETIQRAVRWGIVPANYIVMSGILQDRIFVFMPALNEGIFENNQLEHTSLTFGNYEILESFFDKFGDKVKKFGIDLDNCSDIQRKDVIQNIIKRFAKSLEELRIGIQNDEEFWNELSTGENDIIFPEMKSFQIVGNSIRNEFKLNLIFPKLESFVVFGTVADENCLENVKGLKELMLGTVSIKEHQLEDIFANNANMTNIFLKSPNRAETMRSIAKYLTKLETLAVEFSCQNFLVRANNRPVYKLPSLTHFDTSLYMIDERIVIENPSFDMPNLKKLTLSRVDTGDRIVNFIKHFKKLETLELFVNQYNAVECIQELKHIKEITITFEEDVFESLHQFDLLKNMFEHFDEESQLQTLKFVNFDESLYQNYEDTMKETNIYLENSKKSKWTLSDGDQIGSGQRYMIFKRDPLI